MSATVASYLGPADGSAEPVVVPTTIWRSLFSVLSVTSSYCVASFPMLVKMTGEKWEKVRRRDDPKAQNSEVPSSNRFPSGRPSTYWPSSTMLISSLPSPGREARSSRHSPDGEDSSAL